MYCVKCGVELADTEKKCPLCNTIVYHPDVKQGEANELYPSGKMPKSGGGRAALCGAVIILFMIPMVLAFFSDFFPDKKLDWFGFVAGGIALIYIVVALPMWFKKPNPVIFVPCDFAACAVYLLYIDLVTAGEWFLSFAFPVIGGCALVTCALVTLLRYIKKGRLYIVGGSLIGLGGLVFLIEWLMAITFDLNFIGWSIYPLVSLAFLGGLLIYLAINSDAREKLARKFFF